jgi:hypothetical protein
MKKSNTITLDEFKDKHYGKRGTPKREEFEAGYEDFKIGVLLREARLEKGLKTRIGDGNSGAIFSQLL